MFLPRSFTYAFSTYVPTNGKNCLVESRSVGAKYRKNYFSQRGWGLRRERVILENFQKVDLFLDKSNSTLPQAVTFLHSLVEFNRRCEFTPKLPV